MLLSFALFILLFLSIFLLTSHLNTAIYHLPLLLTRNDKISLAFLLIFLLPGTLMHEFSHFLLATILFVPTGNLTIIPHIEKGTIKAGSLYHAKTDPLRRTLIGIAPMIIGLILIYMIFQFLPAQFSTLFSSHQITLTALFILISIIYLLLTISLSMFSSKKDMEVGIFIIPLFILLSLALYINGFTFTFPVWINTKILDILKKLDLYLFITLVLDILLFVLLKGMSLILQKILRVNIKVG